MNLMEITGLEILEVTSVLMNLGTDLAEVMRKVFAHRSNLDNDELRQDPEYCEAEKQFSAAWKAVESRLSFYAKDLMLELDAAITFLVAASMGGAYRRGMQDGQLMVSGIEIPDPPMRVQFVIKPRPAEKTGNHVVQPRQGTTDIYDLDS